MTRLSLLAVARRTPAWIEAGFNEYNKRLPRELRIKLEEIPPARRGAGRPLEQLLLAEAETLRRQLPKDGRIIALDELGSMQTTREFASRLDGWHRDGLPTCFVIGGADGLHDSVKQAAGEIWSLSSYTLPHALVRVLLAEQIYRAWCILQGHPYHRE